MAIQFFDAVGAVAGEGIFIPIANLPGLTAAELAGAVPQASKMARFLFSFGKKVHSVLSPASVPKLGFTVGRGETSNGLDLISRTFTYSITYSINILSGTISPLPLPSIGNNANLGGFTYDFVFPNIGVLANGNNTPGAGVYIPFTDLSSAWRYTPIDSESVGEDAREFVAAVFAYAFASAEARSATIASAVTAKGRNNPATATLPTGATDPTNPTTGLDPAQINNIVAVNYGWSYTVQTKDDQATETFDVNVIAA